MLLGDARQKHRVARLRAEQRLRDRFIGWMIGCGVVASGSQANPGNQKKRTIVSLTHFSLSRAIANRSIRFGSIALPCYEILCSD